jgi:hypothetical protein
MELREFSLLTITTSMSQQRMFNNGYFKRDEETAGIVLDYNEYDSNGFGVDCSLDHNG